MAGVVVAAIAPHGGIAVAELCDEADLHVAARTRAGLEELGRRFEAAAPEAIVVLTPHNVHIAGSMAVIVAGQLEGTVEEDGRAIALTSPVDVDLSLALLEGLERERVPVTSVSYGGNRPGEASMPMDWGALIPLWYMGGRFDPPPPVVLVSPARDLAAATHVAAGRVIAETAVATRKRVGLIASADHGHAHDPDGPYGFDPASAEYDDSDRRDGAREPARPPARDRPELRGHGPGGQLVADARPARGDATRRSTPSFCPTRRPRTSGCSARRSRRERPEPEPAVVLVARRHGGERLPGAARAQPHRLRVCKRPPKQFLEPGRAVGREHERAG